MKTLTKYILCEDSLDDFDIDGSIARKRAAVPARTKNQVQKAIATDRTYFAELIDDFFGSKDLAFKYSEHTGSDAWHLRTDTGFGFTYQKEDQVQFEVVVGCYGAIDGCGRDKKACKAFMGELLDYIKANSKKKLESYTTIYESSLNSFDSAAYILRFSVKVKNL